MRTIMLPQGSSQGSIGGLPSPRAFAGISPRAAAGAAAGFGVILPVPPRGGVLPLPSPRSSTGSARPPLPPPLASSSGGGGGGGSRKRGASGEGSTPRGGRRARVEELSPVHEAAKAEDLEGLARLLDEQGMVVIDSRDGEAQQTPLMVAVSHGRVLSTLLLLERGASVDLGNQWGITPLMTASMAGNEELVQLLLARGADPAARCQRGWGALSVASVFGFTGVVRALLRTGRVDVNERDVLGLSALHNCCATGHAGTAQALLVEGGADPCVRDRQGRTPLDLAREKDNAACIALLEMKERGFLLGPPRPLPPPLAPSSSLGPLKELQRGGSSPLVPPHTLPSSSAATAEQQPPPLPRGTSPPPPSSSCSDLDDSSSITTHGSSLASSSLAGGSLGGGATEEEVRAAVLRYAIQEGMRGAAPHHQALLDLVRCPR